MRRRTREAEHSTRQKVLKREQDTLKAVRSSCFLKLVKEIEKAID